MESGASLSITENLMKEGVNRSPLDSAASARIRSEIGTAIDDSLARHRAVGLDARLAYESVAAEARVLAQSAKSVAVTDTQAREHNKKVGRYGNFISLAGVCCLGLPILLIFDALTVLLPEDFRDVLSMGSQEESIFGRIALYVDKNRSETAG